MEVEQTVEKASRERGDKLIEEALRKEDVVEKRKWTAPIPVASHYSPRKQSKGARPTQDPSLSSLPDDCQVVLAGRARRQQALQAQTLRDEQSLIDAQLLRASYCQGNREVVAVSSGEDS